MEENTSLPQLSATEIRVLGALLEKSKTTPEYYPMTINSLQAASNQKSSRKPVVNYDESILVETLDSLKKKGLISTVVGGGSRVAKYKHNIAIKYPLVPAELAVLCLLFLRGPLTSGEINSNSGRLYEFETLEEVNEVLHKLASEEPAYVKLLPKKAGQKEGRYIHLFSTFDEELYDANQVEQGSSNSTSQVSVLEERVQTLETELALLRSEFDRLIAELT
ncbi:YceH family protein [Sphingobacterium rhinopitheci]|uniref:YceH family protein n=1 Tax=Sphingobacterium rhinopitheci TaxID=2781960 RepID=UPI001F521A5D|nr:YceH family protein [Sphingobacterium rhinopitheci]MCI0921785.1 YceH family protein [Sphingobacterium rhinopitheci]